MKWTNDVVSQCCGEVTHEMGDMHICSSCMEWCEVYDEEYERDQLWDYMVNQEIATTDELRLVCNILGFTLEHLESVLYVRTGYRSLEQIEEAKA